MEGNRAVLAGTPDFLALAETVQVPAAKRNIVWGHDGDAVCLPATAMYR